MHLRAVFDLRILPGDSDHGGLAVFEGSGFCLRRGGRLVSSLRANQSLFCRPPRRRPGSRVDECCCFDAALPLRDGPDAGLDGVVSGFFRHEVFATLFGAAHYLAVDRKFSDVADVTENCQSFGQMAALGEFTHSGDADVYSDRVVVESNPVSIVAESGLGGSSRSLFIDRFWNFSSSALEWPLILEPDQHRNLGVERGLEKFCRNGHDNARVSPESRFTFGNRLDDPQFVFSMVALERAEAEGESLRRILTFLISALSLHASATTLAGPNPLLGLCKGCNLIVVSADTLRADSVEWWNLTGPTPELARLARKSFRFENAYANAFYTTPSHMTLFTSLYPNRHKVTGSDVHVLGFARTASGTPPLSEKYKTMAEVLRESGYDTRWFGPLTLKHLDMKLGFSRGFNKLEPTLFFRPGREGTPEFNSAKFSQILSEAKGPFFLFLHSYVTHLPYFLENADIPFPGIFHRDKLVKKYLQRPEAADLPPANFVDADKSDFFLHNLGQFQLRAMETLWETLSEEEQKEMRNLLRASYANSVKSLDRQMGQLWSTLEKSGKHKNTLIVFLSDHGEELFDHAGASHTRFYDHTARIPLVIYNPKQVHAEVRPGLASLIDVLPTTLGILGLPKLEQAEGKNLQFEKNDLVFGFSLGSSFVSDGKWKLFRNASGSDELYDLKQDVQEAKNLIGSFWPSAWMARRRLLQAREKWEREQML